MFRITGSRFHRASSVNDAVRYTAGECVGGFNRTDMAADLAALKVGESVTYAAMQWQGSENADPIVITRVDTHADCPRCGKSCPIGPHSSAHCTSCFSGFRVD